MEALVTISRELAEKAEILEREFKVRPTHGAGSGKKEKDRIIF